MNKNEMMERQIAALEDMNLAELKNRIPWSSLSPLIVTIRISFDMNSDCFFNW